MKILRIIALCLLIGSFTMTVSVAKGDTIVVNELVDALGKTKKAKNNRGSAVYDFSRAKRDLRLEDIILNYASLNEGCSIHGAFILANLKKAAAPKAESSDESANRISASFTAINGKLELSLKKDDGKDSLKIVLTAAATAGSPSPEDAKIAADFAAKLKTFCTGDIGPVMRSVLDVLSKRLITLSQMKQPKVEKSNHEGWTTPPRIEMKENTIAGMRPFAAS